MADPSIVGSVADSPAGRQTEVRTFLFVDIRGYTRFTMDRGDEAAAQLATKFAALAREMVAGRGGAVIELRGDEALAVFGSARQALRAALELQARFADETAAEPNLPLPAGMGLDAGEAIPVEGGFRGAALNLAARLCSLAGPGEVLASEGVTHLARKTEGLTYLERGMVELKGFVEPVKVIQVIAGVEVPDGQSATADTASALAETPLPIGGFLGSLPSGPIVAREEELAAILAAVDTVSDGTGQLVLLGGRQGVGKTRLAQEATLVAHKRGFLVATGRCYEPEQRVPFFPFHEALAMAYAAAPSAVRFQLPRRWQQLAPLLPDLLAAPTPDPSADAQEEQQRLIRAVSGFLSAIAHERPVALLFDDLHWADGASLRLLTHLARQTRSRRVLIVGTYRDTELRRDHPLDQAVRELVREHLVERVAVRRLTAEGTAAMVAATVGEVETSEEFVEFVHRRAKGVPYFVEEILRALGGHYRLVCEIGAGGMGRVFQAVDTRTGQAVAAKIMFASKEAEADAALRFEQEGAVLATLQHPNIVQVHGTFMDEHASCIVMELLQGRSLGEILRHPEGSRSLDLARIKHLMQQVAAALASAHQRGIVHRDIKPDNIMVVDDDQVKVTDFGIARILRPTVTLQTIASTGMTLGTPHYMSPEQIDGRKADGRADIYGLGAVLYQLVTGRPPFEGDDPLTIAFKHINETAQPPRKVRPGVPRDWEALIQKMLAKDPAQRFQTAAALEAAIAALSTEDTRKAAGAEPASVARGQAPTPRRSLLRVLTPPPRHDADLQKVVGGDAILPVPRADGEAVAEVPAPGVSGIRERAVRLLSAHPLVSAGAAVVLLALAALWLVRGSQSSGPPANRTPVAIFQAQPSGTFQTPEGVALDRQGNIYVVDQTTDRIQKLGPTGQPLDRWGGPGKGPGQFSGPAAVAVDRQGNIYVTDTNNNRIQKVSPTGQPLKQWGQAGSAPGQFSSPFGIALDASGNIYVADTGNHRIQKLAPNGQPLEQWPRGFQYLVGLAVDAAGNVYVTDSGSERIIELSPAGRVVRHWIMRASGSGQLVGPSGVAVDARGNVYAVDQVNSLVEKFSSGGALLSSWGKKGTLPGEFQGPQGLAVDTHGSVYVADSGNHRVQLLSASGRPLAPWSGTGAATGLFQSPAGLAVDRQGNIIAADDSTNGLIYKITPSDEQDPQWLVSGAVSKPYDYGGVVADRQGNVYVADNLNGAILKLSSTGTRLARWTHGRGGSTFNAPSGLALDTAGNIYVADKGDDRIVKLSPAGKPLQSWGSAGTGCDNGVHFASPESVAVDSSGAMYVVDSGNSSVQKLSPKGDCITQWGSPGSADGQFESPSAIAVDGQGNVYVADTGNNRIQEFSSSGSFVARWGTKGSLPRQFRSPSGVTVDAQGHIYVADTENHRIQKF